MVTWPKNPGEEQWARDFLLARGEHVPEGSHYLFWVVSGKPVWVIAYHGFLGHTVQGSFANDQTRYFPRKLIRAIFVYAFRVLKRKMFFVTVNSTNVRSMQIQLWLGFKELYRGTGLCRDGGDLVLLGMRPEECIWIKDSTNVISEARPPSDA